MDDYSIVIGEKMDEEILRLEKELSSWDVHTDEYETIAKRLTELYQMRSDELNKAEILDEERCKRIAEEKKDKRRNILVGIGIGLGALWGVWDRFSRRREWKEGMEFEETGSFTSKTFSDMRRNKPKDKIDIQRF